MTIESVRKPLSRRPYLAGALFWLAISLLAVIAGGVRWDENYEFAQVILDQIPYPQGHPLYQYVHGFFSLQTYSLAALMYYLPGPFLANLLRNWAMLASSTVPVFLLGALFSRRQIVGHLAVLFVLLEIHTSFYSTYPIHVWPSIFSNGPVGMGFMLTALWALLDRRYRLAGLMLGLAPAMHLGQFPPLLAIAGLHTLWLVASGQVRHARTLLIFAIPGFLICCVFAVFLHSFAVAPPTEGPYFSPVAPETLWRNYMAHYASHRAIPWTTGHLVLFGALVIALALLAARRGGVFSVGRATGENDAPTSLGGSPGAWALGYCAIACALVWGIMAIHYATGPDVPFLLISWLPYRLMNHISPLLIPLLLAIGYARDNRVPGYLVAALLASLLAPLAPLFLDQELADRYLTSGAYLYFFLFGGAVGSGLVIVGRVKRAFAAFGALATVAGLVLLAWFHQYGAACTLVGVLAGAVPLPGRVTPRMLRFAATALACLLLMSLLARNAERRSELFRSDFHDDVARYLAAEGKPDAMILVHYNQVGDQAQFGHPVMADMVTILFTPYRPAIAPAVNAIFQDFYGISLDPDVVARDSELPWYEVWPDKTLEDWQRLSRKYGVEYVAAPSFMQLPLEWVVPGRERNLYRIPAAEDAGPASGDAAAGEASGGPTTP